VIPDRPIPGLVRGRDLTSDQIVEADVAVIGSGAGGSIAAFRLASAGARVVVLEEGGYYSRPDFRMQEGWSYPHLYQDHGNRASDDLSIVVLQGRCVGGGTTVNWTTSFRTPEETLSRWASDHSVAGVTRERLSPHWEEIEARLGVHAVDEGQINDNNEVLRRGARKLGISVELLERNTRECLATGMCGLGCPVNAKQGTLLTYLPDAAQAGAVVYSDCRVDRLAVRGGRVVEAEAAMLRPRPGRRAGPRLTVRARRFVAAAGAINTPRLLQRSGLPDPEGLVGKRTWIHPTVATVATFPERIDPFYGVPQSVGSHHFARRPGKIGFFLETPPVQPMLAGLTLTGFGPRHRDLVRRLPFTNALIGLSIDGFHPGEEGGTVAGRAGGRVSFRYPIGEALSEALREAMKTMARIQLAAGASEVVTFHEPPIVIRKESEIGRIDPLPVGGNRCTVFTAHQMGGCPMGENRQRAVVDSRGKHHHLDNLWVMDGSVFPTSLGVNPQISILGVSSLFASELAGR
jgi:choline dehydrogenase-like flavoprotein